MDEIFLVNSASFQDFEVSASLRAGPGITVDFTAAAEVTGTFSGRGDNLTNVTASYIVPDTNITASSAVSASSAQSASYITPGASFHIVSGSNGIPPSYVDVYDMPTGSYIPSYKEGRMWYDGQYHNMDYYTDDPGFRAQLCKELIIGVHNPSGSTMPRLTVVYVSGSTGNLPDIYPAQADGSGTKSKIIGVVRSNIASSSNGYMLTRGVMHRSNMAGYDVGTALWLSPTVAGGLTSTRPGQPYEEVLVGYCSEAGSNGSFVCAIQDYPAPANAYAGLTSYPYMSDNTASLEVFVGTATVNLYNNADGIGAISQYPLTEATYSIPASATASFIYATSNGVTASYELTSNFNDINGTTKVLVATVYRADIDTHYLQTDREGLALANKINIRLMETEKFVRESGYTLYETGSRNFIVTEGQVWFGATQLTSSTFDSRISESVASPYDEVHWTYHSASVWTIPLAADGKYNNLHYDDGTNLVPLTTDYYVCNYFFRILGDNSVDEDVFIVIGNTQYPDEASAQNDVIPAGLPTVLDDVSLLVGRIIVKSGSNAGLVESAFTTNFGQSLVTQHNNLGGIQGGGGGEFYHMTLSEYTGTGTGVIVRKTGAEITGSITVAISASHAKNSDAAISSTSAGYSTNALSASWASASISSSYASEAGNAHAINFVPPAATSASWVSASARITTADTASYVTASNVAGAVTTAQTAYTANAISFVPYSSTTTTQSLYATQSTYATQSVFATQSVNAYSASWVSASAVITTAATASYVTASNVIGAVTTAQTAYSANAINFVPSAATSASWVSASAFITTAQTSSFVTASNVIGAVATASFASTIPQTISVAQITASIISSSFRIYAPPPTNYSHVATKGYVDNSLGLTQFYYFRTGSAGISYYYAAFDSNTPLSSSESSVTVTAVSESQYVFGFITPAVGINRINAGNISVHYHMYFNSGGGRALNIAPELYTVNGTQENDIGADVPVAISSGVTDAYTAIITLTSSLALAPTDKLLIKFKASSVSSTPDVTTIVDGNTSAGFGVPVPSSNFVVRSGDTMTGALINSFGFIGTASFATSASWAPDIEPTTVPSASWVSASAFITTAQTASFVTASNVVGVVASSSFATSASYAPGGNTGVPETAKSASWVSASVFITTAQTASYVLQAVSASYAPGGSTGVPTTAVSASWVSASAFITTAQTASYVKSSSIDGILSIWQAPSASVATTASYALTTPTSVFSRGGVIFNSSYIPNSAQNINVWRAAFGCTASAVYSDAVGGAGFVVSASINARKNGTSTLLTSSATITGSSTGYSAFTALQNNTFAVGDYLEIMLVGTVGSVSQVSIQIDFTK